MSWKFGLLKSMNDPSLQLHKDDSIIVIKDAYPKAEMHLLVISIKDIPDLASVKKEHLGLLKRMDRCGREMGRKHADGRKFKVGYHAMPSMLRLHLHVISDDYNSPALKTLKHWNSFNTRFFLPSIKVISDVESLGHVKVPSEIDCALLLKTQMKCNKCTYIPKHLPDLKRHILIHLDE